MTARLPSDLLSRSAQESSRLLALSYLDQIEAAGTRLTDPQDAEALHDFRVGLRRLRSSTRAYRSQLEGSITKKMQQRLRKLAQATNAGRDAEVHLNWLRKQGEQLGPEDTQGLSWLIGRLEGRKFETLDPATAQMGRRFVKFAAKLRPRLSTFRVEIGARHRESPSFSQATGELIQQQVSRLGDDLALVRQAADAKEAHRARISIKRLRYLLEPIARRTPRARGLIKRLKEAQDLLGTLHDMHVLSEEIGSSIAALDGSPDRVSDSQRGLRTLERVAREQEAEAFEAFESQWSGELARRFLMRTGELSRFLTEGPAEASADTPRLRLTRSRSRSAEAAPAIGRRRPRSARQRGSPESRPVDSSHDETGSG